MKKIKRHTGADFKALREKHKATPTEWADLLTIPRENIYKLESTKTLTACWQLVYIALKDGNLLSILWQLKKKR
jgi:DNA-binding XRE family transcriptional regulator